MSRYRSEIEQFIYEICFKPMWEATALHISTHPYSLDLSKSRVKYPSSAFLEDMLLEFPCNITIKGDQLCFDAVVSCTILLEESDDYKTISCETKQWLRITSEATVTDKLDGIVIKDICSYTKAQKKDLNTQYSPNIIPYLKKEELDAEAEVFLAEFYPQAIEEPMRVPIEDIATQMGLTVIQGKCLTDDFSIFGEICFSAGKVRVWDLFKCHETLLDVKRGTILIDAYTFWERNLGCVNNTIAHEVYHWHKHRMYAVIKHVLNNEHFIAHRCLTATKYPKGNEDWTDEQRMEWQANNIAPRILMPAKTFRKKADAVIQKYSYLGPAPCKLRAELVTEELASFYAVSRQSVVIRMCELGYSEASTLNSTERFTQDKHSMDASDAFFAYSTNKALRTYINNGLFIYVQNRFVINDRKYIVEGAAGKQLTQYALEHLEECTLSFSWVPVEGSEFQNISPALMHRANASQHTVAFSENENSAVIALSEELRKKRAEFERQNTIHRLTVPYKSGWSLMGDIIKQQGISKSHFCYATGLDEIVYRRAIKGEATKPSLSTILAFSCGLDLDIQTTEKIMQLSGHAFDESDEHRAYMFCITGLSGTSLEYRNEFLTSYGYPTLGSKQMK